MKRLFAILPATITLAAGYCTRSEEVAKYAFRIPTLEGMAELGPPVFDKYSTGKSMVFATITKCFHALPGVHIPAGTISSFYHDHFVSLGLIPWQERDSLTGRFVLPSTVLKGEAHVCSRGMIAYWVPTNGDFVCFNIQQTRDYTIGSSDVLLRSIISAFESAAKDFGFNISQPSNITVSDWPTYYENESFVDDRVLFVQYKNPGFGCMDDDGNYMFRLSVYANSKCAEQQFYDMSGGKPSSRDDAATPKIGLVFPPIVINNVVVQYMGDLLDEPNLEFTASVTRNLVELAATNQWRLIRAEASRQPQP